MRALPDGDQRSAADAATVWTRGTAKPSSSNTRAASSVTAMQSPRPSARPKKASINESVTFPGGHIDRNGHRPDHIDRGHDWPGDDLALGDDDVLVRNNHRADNCQGDLPTAPQTCGGTL